MRLMTIALGAAVVTAAATTAAIAKTEQPKYTVVERLTDKMEIRRYGSRALAEVEIAATDERSARTQAFRILAAYIFGKNRSKAKISMTAPVETQTVKKKGAKSGRTSEKIAMTAPVETQRTGGKFRMAFFLPAKYSVKTAPKPLDPRVRLRTAPPVLMAAYRFSGRPDEADMDRRWRMLKTKLAASRWKPVGKRVGYFYNPPWTLPMFRRNEVAVTVRRQ